jgi:hypothetical protein
MSLADSKELDSFRVLHRLKYHIRNSDPGSCHILSREPLHRYNFAQQIFGI